MSLKLLKGTLPKKAFRRVMGEGIGGGRLPRNSRSRMASQKARWRMSHPFQGPAGGHPQGWVWMSLPKNPWSIPQERLN